MVLLTEQERRELLLDAAKTLCKKGYSFDQTVEVFALTMQTKVRQAVWRDLQSWYAGEWNNGNGDKATPAQ